MKQFITFVSKIAQEQIERRNLKGIEEIGIQVGILDIFEKNHDPEQTYYELLDYLEKQNSLKGLMPAVQEFYKTHYLNK